MVASCDAFAMSCDMSCGVDVLAKSCDALVLRDALAVMYT